MLSLNAAYLSTMYVHCTLHMYIRSMLMETLLLIRMSKYFNESTGLYNLTQNCDSK